MAKLTTGRLHKVLKFHNISSRGNKDQLVLKVALLRSGRKRFIHHNEKQHAKQLMHAVQNLISEQIKLDTSVPRKIIKRKYESPIEPEVSVKEPRKMASIQSMYTKSTLKVPTDLITLSTIGDMLKPLHWEILNIDKKVGGLGMDKNLDVKEPESEVNDEYEQFFEIGIRVMVKWTQKDVGKLGWNPGWYVAEVQESSIENDWIKVEYSSEPESIYKIDVTSELANGTLKLK